MIKASGSSKGKPFHERVLAGELRNLTLQECIKVLKGNDIEFKKQLLLRLATNVLPRISQHEGQDGDPIKIEISKEIAEKNASNSVTITNS